MPNPSPRSKTVVALLAAVACSEGTPPKIRSEPAAPLPVARAGSWLWVDFPELDQRLVAIDLKSGRVEARLYPDTWQADLSAVVDFAVDDRHLFLLHRDRYTGAQDRLLALPAENARTPPQSIPLPAKPEVLHWHGPTRLIVGHSTDQSGQGHLSLVDSRTLKRQADIALPGDCLSIASIEATRVVTIVKIRHNQHSLRAGTKALVEVDLEGQRVARIKALPPGSQQVIRGPNGRLYLSHASASGKLATDGRLSVFDPTTLARIESIDLGMLVRQMRASREYLVVNALSTTGESWLTVLDRDQRTVAEHQLPTVAGEDFALHGQQALLPLRRGGMLQRLDLRGAASPTPWRLPTGHAAVDRAGRLRLAQTWN